MTLTTLKNKVIQQPLPEHIAIIMDGNGRWAKERSLPRLAGHREGVNSVRVITRICGDIGIKHLTLYTFSAENWNRPKKEVSALMKLLLNTISKEIKALHKNNVRFSVIGNIEDLPEDVRKGLNKGIDLMAGNTGLNLNLALSYGSRQEILQAVHRITAKVTRGEIDPNHITTETISNHLYTVNLPDPDLLIRTGKENRVSNFLLWQIAYTELYMAETFWPDFREREILEAIECYQNRERRFGKLTTN